MRLSDAITVLPDARAVAERAAHVVLECAREAIAARGRFTLALTGGSSPHALYTCLASEPFRTRVDWARVHLFWGDERAVGPSDPQSNYRMAMERLVGAVPVPSAQVHRMPAERDDLETAAGEYEREIETVTGPDGALDLILLGLGHDAHILSLHPGCAEITRPTARVVALRSPPMNPALDRMTLTPRALLAARAVLLLAQGAAKRDALAAVLDEGADVSKVPGRLLARARNALVLADCEARPTPSS